MCKKHREALLLSTNIKRMNSRNLKNLFFNVAAFTIVCLDKHRGHFYRANPNGVLATPLSVMRKPLPFHEIIKFGVTVLFSIDTNNDWWHILFGFVKFDWFFSTTFMVEWLIWAFFPSVRYVRWLNTYFMSILTIVIEIGVLLKAFYVKATHFTMI